RRANLSGRLPEQARPMMGARRERDRTTRLSGCQRQLLAVFYSLANLPAPESVSCLRRSTPTPGEPWLISLPIFGRSLPFSPGYRIRSLYSISGTGNQAGGKYGSQKEEGRSRPRRRGQAEAAAGIGCSRAQAKHRSGLGVGRPSAAL